MQKKICVLFLIALLLLFGCSRKYPVIYAPDARIGVGESYDADDGVHALDSVDGDLTDQSRITSGDLNTQKSGRYRIRYEVTNSRGVTTKASRIITVSNQSASFWRVWIIAAVVCVSILLLCIVFVFLRAKKKEEPLDLPPQIC